MPDSVEGLAYVTKYCPNLQIHRMHGKYESVGIMLNHPYETLLEGRKNMVSNNKVMQIFVDTAFHNFP